MLFKTLKEQKVSNMVNGYGDSLPGHTHFISIHEIQRLLLDVIIMVGTTTQERHTHTANEYIVTGQLNSYKCFSSESNIQLQPMTQNIIATCIESKGGYTRKLRIQWGGGEGHMNSNK